MSTIRFRIAALATVVVALVLVVSAVGLAVVQRQQLTASVDRSLSERADSIVAAASDGAAASDAVGQTRDLDRAAQLVSAGGSVLAATTNLAGARPLAAPPGAGRGQIVRTLDGLPLDDDRYRVLSRRVEIGGEEAVLHVAEDYDDVDEAVRGLALALALAIPGVAAVLAGLVWWLVGWTLRPVESIRAEVAEISGTDPSRRVRVPDHDDEISQLASTMNQMLERVAAAAEQQRRFVADASHELRTPLTRIRAELEVDLSRPGPSAELVATHRRVLAETVMLQQLVSDLLFLARSDAGATPPRHETIDLDDVVFAEVAHHAGDRRIRLDLERVEAVQVRGERSQLARAVGNLLANAMRHARREVAITLAELDGTVTLAVADDGPGVPAEAKDVIFERFGRAGDARTSADGGSGLGLAIAREIVERHGGTLSLDPAAPSGRFVITLPGDET